MCETAVQIGKQTRTRNTLLVFCFLVSIHCFFESEIMCFFPHIRKSDWNAKLFSEYFGLYDSQQCILL